MQILRNQKESDMQAPDYPITPLRQIAIILAHAIFRMQCSRSLSVSSSTQVWEPI